MRREIWLCLALAGCAGGAVVATSAENATSCTDSMRTLIFSSSTCTELQGKTDALLRNDPACRATFGDAGFDVCAKRRDGGARKEGGPDGSD